MRFAVILSGCGVRDGSEIHEAVSALLSIDQLGHEALIYAPDREQAMVVNGVTGRPMGETRNILVESSRIARGSIKPLSLLEISEFDGIVLPGGFGAALNLCDFAHKGADCSVDSELEAKLTEAHKMGKVLGFMCIAPVIAARLFGREGVRMTIGRDEKTSQVCEAMGAVHVPCSACEACVDERLRIVTTPAYMEAQSISECYASAHALIEAMVSLG